MKPIVLILAISAMGVGAYRLYQTNPDLQEKLAKLLRLNPGEEEKSEKSKGSITKVAQKRIQTISHGEKVDVAKHVNPKGKTIVEFTAAW